VILAEQFAGRFLQAAGGNAEFQAMGHEWLGSKSLAGEAGVRATAIRPSGFYFL
jgi:hypothetical protein